MQEPAQAPMPPRPRADFAAAIGFLTLLPFGRDWPDERPPRSVGWYPWIGWVLGLLVALPLWVVLRVGGPLSATGSLLAGAVVVALWALLTRFLHWDGLADTFDGLWGGATPEKRLEIMRDSRIGSFGAAAMVMVALLQVTSVAVVLAKGGVWVLVMAPVLGRLAASMAAWQLPPARRDGLGLTAMERPAGYDVGVAVAAVAALALTGAAALSTGPAPIAWLLLTARMMVVLVAGAAAAFAVPRVLAEPVGGMTGDLFGATVLIVETVVLLVGALVA
jgi:adenosylcobinamide-GDP ribazoletransferase